MANYNKTTEKIVNRLVDKAWAADEAGNREIGRVYHDLMEDLRRQWVKFQAINEVQTPKDIISLIKDLMSMEDEQGARQGAYYIALGIVYQAIGEDLGKEGQA